MTLSTQICKRIYQADGQTRTWELDFPVLSEEHLQIFVRNSAGAETRITSGYKVNLAQGTVVYPTLASGLDVLCAGESITLLRVTPPTQTTHLTQQGVLDANELEHSYDKLTMHVQELVEQTQRCIKYTPSSGRTGEDADTFLAELQQTQTAALNTALESVAQTESTLQAALSTEETTRSQADLSLQQQLQTLSGLVSQRASEITAEATARQTADSSLQSSLETESAARISADQALSDRIDQLNFIQFVTVLPASGNAKYIYAVPQNETDLDNYPIVVLYVWSNDWYSVGAFSTNLDPVSLLTKSEAASTYLTQTSATSTYLPLAQKAAANGVASLDANSKLISTQIPYATSSSVGGIKQIFDGSTNTWTVITEDL